MSKEQTNIEDLKEKTSMLLKLLEEPSPGTFSWHETVHKLAGEIGDYTNVVAERIDYLIETGATALGQQKRVMLLEHQIKALQQRLDKVERWTDMPGSDK